MALLLPNLRQVIKFSSGLRDAATKAAVRSLEEWADDLVRRLAKLEEADAGATLPIAESDVTGLVADLAAKAAATHTHAEADVTNLVTDLAAKVPSTRTITATSPVQIAGGTSADLSADRTISVLDNSTSNKGVVAVAPNDTTKFYRGDASWAVPPGFAFSDVAYHPSADPSSPNALDDDFNGGSLGGAWTVFNSTGVSNGVANSALTVTKAAAGDSLSGYTQSFSPGSANWTFESRMNLAGVGRSGTAYPTAGLVVTDGTKYVIAGFFNANGTQSLGIHYWTNTTTFNSETTASITLPVFTAFVTGGWTYPLDLWVRLQRSGNDAILQWSANGFNWTTLTRTNGISSLGTITGIGVGIQNNNGASVSPRWHYFRKVA